VQEELGDLLALVVREPHRRANALVSGFPRLEPVVDAFREATLLFEKWPERLEAGFRLDPRDEPRKSPGVPAELQRLGGASAGPTEQEEVRRRSP
jgi:hypothetical protein